MSDFCFTVTPAYGRDYTHQAAALKDWVDGKDWVNATQLITGGGTYLSERDCDRAKIRYAGLERVFIVQRNPDKTWRIES